MLLTRTFSLLLALALAAGCSEQRDKAPTEARIQEKPAPTVDTVELAANRVQSALFLSHSVTPLETGVIRGVALPTYAEFPELTYLQMVDRAQSVGATHISLIVNWEQDTIYHNEIRPRTDISDGRVREIIKHAHAKGLKVMLFPILHIKRRSDGEWRGKLAPTSLKDWHSNYAQFIRHYALLAEQEGVEIFSVGSELSSMEAKESFWRELIAEVRKITKSRLIYSSNWDHYQVPKFWEDLDYIGVSSYFEVAETPRDSVAAISQGWTTVRDELLGFSKTVQKPLVLTEVGYPSVDAASVHPWDYTAKSGPNPVQQLAAYQGLVQAWSGQEFGGLFLWHGWGRGGHDDTSYAFWEKPTQYLVERWFDDPDMSPQGREAVAE